VSPIRFRPEGLRIPWQAIATFAVAAYVLRSALRSWDFVPDAVDLVVFGMLAVILLARPLVELALKDDETEADDPLL
jgi:hypothetical protein